MIATVYVFDEREEDRLARWQLLDALDHDREVASWERADRRAEKWPADSYGFTPQEQA